MLITLQSNSDSDASNFSNFFKETVQIEPRSEIAMVNMSYKFSNAVGGDREAQNILVNLDDFQLQSVCKDGGVQKAIASIPYGSTEPQFNFNTGVSAKIDGEFFYEPFNLNYHKLGNEYVENHNQLKVRLTDAVGNSLILIEHPVSLTIDIRPKTK